MKYFDLAGLWRYRPDDSPAFADQDYDDSAWSEMAIPQNWFLGGLDHHGVVWFRCHFEAAGRQAGQFATLRFEGVDYAADVYLNGEHLGGHKGYFEPFEFDVSDVLKQGNNTLAVRVDSPFEPVGPDGWHMRKKLIKGVLNHHDCRPGGGWVDSGQAFNSGGIWNRVTLLIHEAITVDRVMLRADLAHKPATLRGEVTFRNRGGARKLPMLISCAPENFTDAPAYEIEIEADIPPGLKMVPFSMPVPSIQLWQPWDRGYPYLYRVEIAKGASRRSPADVFHTISFGFRTISVDETFGWKINGRPYFPRGSNYIASQWLSETLFPGAAAAEGHPFPPPPGDDEQAAGAGISRSWYERDVALMKEANLNMIRVHAHVLPPEFHDACDRAGLLVWQDFPFQWGYSDDPAFHKEAERQMEAMVRLLNNHPSIVAWCVHNESPWDADWMAEEAGGSYEPDHNRALDAYLEVVVRSLDATRHVQRNSGTGDGHVYPGWYEGHWLDYRDLPGAPFPTEYGAQGIPAVESAGHIFRQFGQDGGHAALARFKEWIDNQPQFALVNDMPPLEDVPIDLHDAYEVWKTWLFHDFQPLETFYRAGINLGNSLEEFVANSQAYQNKIIQFGTEKYRRHKYDRIKGIMQFMFVEPWPAITWAVLDYWRLPKSSFAVLSRAMQPILPILDDALVPVRLCEEPGRRLQRDLYIVNDTLNPYPGAAFRWRLWVEGDGRETLATGSGTTDILADGVTEGVPVVIDLASPALNEGAIFLDVEVFSAENIPLGNNHYILHTLLGGNA